MPEVRYAKGAICQRRDMPLWGARSKEDNMKKDKKEKTKKPSRRAQLVELIREDKKTFAVYIVLRLIVIAVAVLQFFNGNYANAALCVFTLVLFLLPAFVESNFGVRVPSTLEIIVLLFIFAAEILGELGDFYVKFTFWDTMLHTLNGFLAAAVGLSLIDLLNRSKRFDLHLSPVFVALVSFCFSMTIGVLWEFFEFGMDRIFLTDMQKDTVVNVISSVALNPDGVNKAVILRDITDTAVNGQSLGLGGYLDIGLIDTMKDLLVNFIGAVVFSVFGYFYTKHEGNSRGAKVVEGLKIQRREKKSEE